MNRKEKLYIRIIAFITSCIIAIVGILAYGLPIHAYSGVVAGDTVYYLKDIASIPDTFFDSSTYNNYVGYDTDLSTVYAECLSQRLPFQLYIYNNYSSYESYFEHSTGFVTFGSDSNMTTLNVVLGSQGSVICTDSLHNTYLCYSDFNNIPNHPNWGIPAIMQLGWGHNGALAVDDLQRNTFRIKLDDIDYLAIPITQYVVNSSFDVYYVDSVINGEGAYISSGSANSPSNPNVGSETADNNLYFKDFGISYDIGSSMTNGTIVLSGTPNSYMINHPEEFTLVYSYTFDYKFVLNKTDGWVYETKATTDPYQVPLSTFINNGNYIVDNLKTVEQSKNVTYTRTLQGVELGAETKSIYEWWTYFNNQNSEEVINWSELQWQRAKLICSVFVVANQDSVMETFNHSSGMYSKTYDFLTGRTGTSSDNSITNNHNPYNSSSTSPVGSSDIDVNNTTPHVTPNNIPSSNNPSSDSTTSSNNGGITINNNNTLNGGSGFGTSSGVGDTSEAGMGSSLVNTFFNTFNPLKMVFNAMIGDSEVVSDEIIETIGANKFLNFVSDSFGFLPSSFWVSISTFFGACLVVLIIAFIFKVIISIL